MFKKGSKVRALLGALVFVLCFTAFGGGVGILANSLAKKSNSSTNTEVSQISNPDANNADVQIDEDDGKLHAAVRYLRIQQYVYAVGSFTASTDGGICNLHYYNVYYRDTTFGSSESQYNHYDNHSLTVSVTPKAVIQGGFYDANVVVPQQGQNSSQNVIEIFTQAEDMQAPVQTVEQMQKQTTEEFKKTLKTMFVQFQGTKIYA